MEHQKPKKRKKWLWIVLGLVVLLGLIGACSGNDGETKKSEEPKAAETHAAAQTAAPEPTEQLPDMTMGEKNALKSAQSYLAYSAFSHSGLIEQLEYEGFTAEQAAYGADNCGADWNVQAEKSAKSYLDYSAFSREELISQLEYEGFTHEQAVHGAEANGY